MEAGRVSRIGQAVRAAADLLGHHDVPLPGLGRVRKHAQAMRMQAMGEAGYLEHQRHVLSIAEEIMSVFELAIPEATTLLMGRAAAGLIDADPAIHLRITTSSSVEDISRLLLEFGFDELTYRTSETKYGRMNQICWTDEGIDVILTRCPPQVGASAQVDLFTGYSIQSLDLKHLRQRLAREPNSHD